MELEEDLSKKTIKLDESIM